MTSRIRSSRRRGALLGLAAGAALASAANIAWTAPSRSPGAPCFFITQWNGWKSPDPKVIYLGVNMHDVYRVDLSAGSPLLQAPDVHLVSRTTGPDTVCSALDLQLEVTDEMGFHGRLGGGMHEPLIVAKLTKLTPEEVAAIPRRYRPN